MRSDELLSAIVQRCEKVAQVLGGILESNNRASVKGLCAYRLWYPEHVAKNDRVASQDTTVQPKGRIIYCHQYDISVVEPQVRVFLDLVWGSRRLRNWCPLVFFRVLGIRPRTLP